jgi:hypothetical protein
LDQRKSLQDKNGILLATGAALRRQAASARATYREGLRLGQVFSSGQETLRVLRHTRDPNFKMQVRTCRAPCGAHRCDLLPPFDDIAFFDESG